MSDIAQLGLAVDSTQVVAGKTALDQLTTSGGKAETAVTALGKSSTTASVAQKALAAATSGVSGQLIALSAGAGPVGVFLSSLGPWGLAAAAGLGAIGAAFSYVREEAARMGGKAVELNAFRAATDLTIAQISALKQAGAQFGVTGDTIQTSFERLTAQLQDARRATGPLYDDVQKIDGALAKQLENARSTAEGIDVLAKAYNAAGDASAKLDLARSIFGRGGAVIGPLLGKINDSGGLVKLAEQLKNVGDQSDDVTAQWARMQAQIDQSNKRAQNILASIFTPEGLALSLKAAETMERFATAAKYAADLRKQSGSGFLSFLGDAANASDPQSSIESGARQRDAAYAAKAAADGWAEYDRAIAASVTPSKEAATSQEKLAKSIKEAQDAAAAASKTQQDLMTFLGSGATIADRLTTRLKDISAAYADNRTGAANSDEAKLLKTRADSAAQLDALIQKESLRIGTLGAQASVADAVIQKQLEINKANQQGAGITSTQAKAVLAYTAAQALGTLAIRQQISAAEIEAGAVDKGVGVAAAFRAEQEKLADFRLRGIKLTDDQVAALHREADALGKATQKAAERKALSDALFEGSQFGRTDTEARVAATLRQLYGSDFQAQQEGAIANQVRFNETLKSTKAFGEDALSGFLRDVRDGKSATEALQGVLIKLENKMFDIASNQLMSALLGGTTGGGSGGLLGSLLKGLGGSGGGGATASTGSNSGFAIGGNHEGGIVGSEATFMRMFGGARRHHTGTGNVGIDEVPIIAKRGEGVFTEGQMRKLAPVGQGGGGPIQVNIMNAPAGTGAEVKQTPQPGGGVRIDVALKRMIEDQVGASLRSGQGPIHDALNQDYGLSKRLT